MKLLFFALLLTMSFAHAQEKCDALQANRYGGSGAYVFKQYKFENKSDLVILTPTTSPQAEVRRVTFGRGDVSQTCYFKPLAFAQGGEAENFWGWHMLWAEPSLDTGGLYYARMDGEAWVSSSPKRLSKLSPINPHFKIENQTITVTWQQVENGLTANIQAISSDEGRSWVVAPIQ